MDRAQTVIKVQIDRNLTKHKETLLYLKRISKTQPDIDVFSLSIIFNSYANRLQKRISKIKEYC
jgi:hypothetical protein